MRKLDVHFSSGSEEVITPEANWMQARDFQWAESDQEPDEEAEEETYPEATEESDEEFDG